MYRPTAFDEPDEARLHALIDEIGMAVLVSKGPDGLEASHLPVLLDAGEGPRGTILGHLARANPHWRGLDGAAVLLVLQGPNGYVSPNWYPTKRRTGAVVPT
jgi:transcriptional regulator